MILKHKPGILLNIYPVPHTLPNPEITKKHSKQYIEYGCEQPITIADWLLAGVNSRKATSFTSDQSNKGISVLFDGYLTDYLGNTTTKCELSKPAKLISKAYCNEQLNFLSNLRGSYCGLIIDYNHQTAYLFNDRRGSRPLFIAERNNGQLAIAPEVGMLISMDEQQRALSLSGIGAFLIRGYFYDNDTLFEGITTLPYASLVTFNQEGSKLSRYWALNYAATHQQNNEAGLLEQADSLLIQATKRCLTGFSAPLLSLSGGIDSRVVLSYLLDQQPELSVLAYGHKNHKYNDVAIAGQLSKTFSLAFTNQNLNLDNFTEHASYATTKMDGRNDILDAPDIVKNFESLEGKFDVCFNGDQCFGWKGHVSNNQQAIDATSRWSLDSIPRVFGWLHSEQKKTMPEAVHAVRARMLARAKHSDPDAVKDLLFYNESLSNVLNSYTARRLPVMEVARPLLDEDVMEFVATLPASYRWEKKLLTRILATRAYVNKVPLATKSGLASNRDFVHKIQTDRRSAEFFRHNLLTATDPRIEAIFNMHKIASTLDTIIDNRQLPPVKRNWLDTIPLVAYFAPPHISKVHPLISLRRLMAINLYLTSLNNITTKTGIKQ